MQHNKFQGHWLIGPTKEDFSIYAGHGILQPTEALGEIWLQLAQ